MLAVPFVPILAYHKVQSDFDLSFTRVSPRQFESQIRFLWQAGYRSLSIAQYVHDPEIAARGRKVIITFDDAYACAFEQAFPILRKYGFTASVFVISGYVSRENGWDYQLRFKARHCSWPQIRELTQAGWEIGSHTISHRNLLSLKSYADRSNELRKSKEDIESEIQQTVKVLSYPYGKYDDYILDLAEATGYAAGCSLGQNTIRTQCFPYALTRRGVYAFDSLKTFALKLRDDFYGRVEDIKQMAISACANGSVILQDMKAAKARLHNYSLD